MLEVCYHQYITDIGIYSYYDIIQQNCMFLQQVQNNDDKQLKVKGRI